MLQALDFLREVNLYAIALKLVLSMLFGGLIGLERGRKRRPAGFRTYMLVCLGAAMTVVMGQYVISLGEKADVARIGAQAINGIGFLGAGTILVTGKQQVKGLTTAAGLWACACMGLAIGAGFYECVIPVFLLIFLSVRFFPWLEAWMVEKDRNMNFYAEFTSMDDLGPLLSGVKEQQVHIYEVDLDRGEISQTGQPNGVFAIRLPKGLSHTRFLSAMTELECITMIQEL